MSHKSKYKNYKNIKIILIHGNGSSTTDEYWLPFVASELRKCGLTVINRQFPDTYFAYKSTWVPFLKDELKADENTIIIGYSSGATAAMKFAENNKILGTVLVSSYHTDLGMDTERKSGYFDTPWQWEAIKNNQNWVIQFASVDDPWIPIEEPRLIQKKLESEYHEYNNRGHFNQTHFPELVKAIKKKLLISSCP